MNNDLINRNAVIEEFYKLIGGDLDASEVYYIEKVINSIPTAYDVDKVVEQLEEAKYEDELYPCNLCVEIEEAKRIVKSGGIERNR